jgi:Leucine-rich repeat (LRR) protein
MLRHFTKLERLDLSFNTISAVTVGLNNTPNLRYFYLEGNTISSFDTLRYIQDSLKSLHTLDLRFNPVSKRKGYRAYMCRAAGLKVLKVLDGVSVDEKVKGAKPALVASRPTSPSETKGVVGSEIWVEKSSNQPHLFRPLSVRTQFGYGSSAAQNEYWRIMNSPNQDISTTFSFEKITVLELDNCNLFDLDQIPLGCV